MRQTAARTASLTAVLLVASLSFRASAYGQQSQPIEWHDQGSLSRADRSAILTLAKDVGLQHAKRIYLGKYVPVGCPYVMASSTYAESGHLRTYLELTVHRTDWECVPDGIKSKRVGRWLAFSTDLLTRREWKIQEGQWVKYVPFFDGVSHQHAEQIVLAIRHRRVANRVPGVFEVPTIDPYEITSIQVNTNSTNTFEVRTSKGGASGDFYVIKINNHLVELHGIGDWIA